MIATRSRLMSRLAGQGAMALLELDAEATEALIADYPEVAVAVYASPRQTVIAGPPDAGRCGDRGGDRRRTGWPAASRSMSPPITASWIRSCPSCGRRWRIWRPGAPRFRCSPPSTASTATQSFDAEYWVANLRHPVRFAQAVAAAGADHTTFIEISPHPLLTHAISDTLGDTHHHALGTLTRDTHDTVSFHTNLNTTHTTHPPAHRAPTRTPPPATHHPLAPHPPLDHHQRCDGPRRHAPAARHRRHGSNQRHARVGKRTRPGSVVAG